MTASTADSVTGPGSSWSTWGMRLVAVLSVALAICLGWAWVETFYRHVTVNAQLSNRAMDLPRPNGFRLHEGFRAITGDHFFGDFQLPLVYARDLRHSISPYLGRRFPEQYPPFAQVLFIPLTFLPLKLAAGIYLLLSAAVFLVPLWLLLAPLRREYRIIFLVVTAVVTMPFVTLLDRGNDIGLTVGLVAWGIWAWKTERWVWCGALLATAIALKAYPATLLVVPLALRRYRFTVLVAASALVANLLVVIPFPGSPVRNVRAGLSAMVSFKSSSLGVARLSWSLFSVIPNTAGLLFGRHHANSLLEAKGLLVWLPSVLFLCGVYLVIRRGRVPQWCWGVLSLATIQLVVPVSFFYTAAWAPVAAVWYIQGRLVDVDEPDDAPWTTLRILLLLALTATLTPSVFTITGVTFTTPLTRYLSPLLILGTWCVAIFSSLRSRGTDGRPETEPEASISLG